MDQTKITLSPKELELVTNADWILTKNGIIRKVKELLEHLQEEQAVLLDSHKNKLPKELFTYRPKISKGENYKGLPYLVLDQPRVFEKENVFAIRTLFWWGNFFSVTLHLSGKYKELFENKLSAGYHELVKNGSFYCIHADPWEHHFEETNYSELKTLDEQEFCSDAKRRPFIKIANRWMLSDWENIDTYLNDYYKLLIVTLAS